MPMSESKCVVCDTPLEKCKGKRTAGMVVLTEWTFVCAECNEAGILWAARQAHAERLGTALADSTPNADGTRSILVAVDQPKPEWTYAQAFPLEPATAHVHNFSTFERTCACGMVEQ
jgi:hypothetical protein